MYYDSGRSHQTNNETLKSTDFTRVVIPQPFGENRRWGNPPFFISRYLLLMKLLSITNSLILEATEYVRKITMGRRVIKLYTQEHQEENVLDTSDLEDIEKVFNSRIRRRLPSPLIANSIRDNFDRIWENADGILRGCSYKSCRILFIDNYKGLGQIEYILQFYRNTKAQVETINAVIITSAISKEGDDFLKSMKTPTPKVRLSESNCDEMKVVYL